MKRKLKFLGHVLRHNSTEKIVLESMIEGKRGRGRPRRRWFDNVKQWTDLSFMECKRVAQQRQTWRTLVADLLKGDGRFDGLTINRLFKKEKLKKSN